LNVQASLVGTIIDKNTLHNNSALQGGGVCFAEDAHPDVGRADVSLPDNAGTMNHEPLTGRRRQR
jgi:hypothetical protein